MADVIVSNVPGSFPWSVLHERHPALIARVRDATPYGPGRREALDALLGEIDGAIGPLAPGAADRGVWEAWGSEKYVGRPWDEVPFLWAESYFYRRLLDAAGYFGPGPWRGIDPFAPFKAAELDGLAPPVAGLEEQALLHASLWGNRADLGFRISAGEAGLGERVTGLVADDSAGLWAVLDRGAPGRLCVVADNAGPELLPDLLLADQLLATHRVSEVLLHVKPYPYYVSDATPADVIACLRRAGEAGKRLWQAMADGRLIVRAHPFSCAPLPYQDMPDDLRADFGSATLTIMKGDLNYRRLVCDRHWAATTPYATVTGYFPGPVAALRTLKSEVVVGLDEATVAALDAGGQSWRTAGTHALIQV